MGIKGLTGLIGDVAPGTIKEDQIKNYFGRKIAIDASMSLYSFLVAVRMEGNQLLTNEMGETTRYTHFFCLCLFISQKAFF
jgi:flap endonuclease-1